MPHPQLAPADSWVLITGMCSSCHPGCLQNIWPVVYVLGSFPVLSSLSSAPAGLLKRGVQPPTQHFSLLSCGNQLETAWLWLRNGPPSCRPGCSSPGYPHMCSHNCFYPNSFHLPSLPPVLCLDLPGLPFFAQRSCGLL